MSQKDLQGLRVLALESRRAKEIATLIRNQGGEPQIAPALREAPLESNSDALEFAAALMRDEFDVVVFLTGVGVRALLGIVETQCGREAFLEALRRVKVAARGPKPLAVLRELQVPVSIAAVDPFTWRELVAATEEQLGGGFSGLRIAVIEYGAPSEDLLSALAARNAIVSPVPVYQWALPDDIEPLREAVDAIVQGKIDLVLFTNGAQPTHLFRIAQDMGLAERLAHGLRSTVVASIGPSTTEQLDHLGLSPDFEPSHPKMGLLVNETSQIARQLVQQKRVYRGGREHS